MLLWTAVMSEPLCRPYVCAFPRPIEHAAGDRWTCPRCSTTYRLTRRKGWRWWRNWAAPYGAWITTARWVDLWGRPHSTLWAAVRADLRTLRRRP